jgi:hypothetical protein
MMNARQLSVVLSLLLLSILPVAAGCVDEPDRSPDVEEADVLSSSDAAIEKEIGGAIVGLETSGGEGEPDPYKVTHLRLRTTEKMTDEVLLRRLLPKLRGVARDDDPIAGLDETPITSAWAELTAEPNASYVQDASVLAKARATAKKWREVKDVVDRTLTNVRYVDMGYRGSPGGSLETGAVAHVIVGQTTSGRVIAIWGIDIWT